MEITFDVAVDGSFTDDFDTFEGLQSSYTVSKAADNPNLYFYNRQISGFNASMATIQVRHGKAFNYQKSCSVRVGLGIYSWVDIELECYAQILTAKVQGFLGNDVEVFPGVEFLGTGGTWNGTSAPFPISEPALTLPIRVHGEFFISRFYGDPGSLVPFDYTITGLLPFEEMGQ